MPQKVWTDVRLLLDGLDLSGDANAFSFVHGADVPECTVLTNLGRKRTGGGLISTDFAHEGYWNANGLDGVDEILFARIGVADVLMSIFPDGIADGSRVFFLAGVGGSYAPGAPVGEMFLFSFAGQSSHGDGMLRGSSLHYNTRTASGNGGAGVNLGAVGANQRLYAGLHVFGASGTTPTLDAIIQSDDSGAFSTPLTRVTFTQRTGKGSQYAASVAGPITDTFWRASWTIGGTTPSFTFAIAMAIR